MILRTIAEWTSSLRAESIPASVRMRVRAQVLSTLASAHAAVHSRAARAVFAAVAKWGEGTSPIVATGTRVGLHAALLANAASTMAFDYDDYLFLGHTGHSAVWTPLLLGAEGGDLLAAIVAANEVAGRLGAACFYGPQNGQLWSFIHLAGAAVAAARAMRLDAARTADALAIALSQPNYALYPGLMGCEAKLLTAATPAVAGLQAAQLAAEGLTGRHEVLDDPRGFLTAFSFHPQPHMLTGWGEAWVTDTLAVKPYPGCAYIDSTIDSIRDFLPMAGGRIAPEAVAAVNVDATLMTVAMNRMGQREGAFGPVDVNFSIPLSVAVTLLEGDLTAAALADENLARRRGEIVSIASKVRLRHDHALTEAMLAKVAETIGFDRMLGTAGWRDLLRIRRGMKRSLGGGTVTFGDLRPFLGMAPFTRFLFPPREVRSLSGVDFSQVTLPIAARVTLHTVDGKAYQGSRHVPRGAGTDVEDVAREKWRREAASLGAERVAEVERLVEGLGQTSARLLLDTSTRSTNTHECTRMEEQPPVAKG